MTSLNQNTIKHKTGLLNLTEELGNISKACKVMGFSRDIFYRYRDARDQGGLDALFDKSRRQPNLKNRRVLRSDCEPLQKIRLLPLIDHSLRNSPP